MKQTIFIDGVKYYELLIGCVTMRDDIYIYGCGEQPGARYRKAPPSRNKPRKAKKQRQAKRVGPRKVIEHEGVKWYIVDGDGLKGDIAVSPGALDVDVVVSTCPASRAYGYTLYRRNPTRLIDSVECFMVRSGHAKDGDWLSQESDDPHKIGYLAGARVSNLMGDVWRPVRRMEPYQTRVIDGVEHSRVLSGRVHKGDMISISPTTEAFKAITTVGIRVTGMNYVIWRPVKKKAVPYPSDEALAWILDEWFTEEPRVHAKEIRAYLVYAKKELSS